MKIIDWIQCGNDCEKCPYLWEEKTSYEYDEYDCGCYIKHDLYDEKPCHLLMPVRAVLGFFAKKKAEYSEAHMYDGIEDYYEKMIVREHNERLQDNNRI